ncbi:MAG: MFS transporter [Bacilli bacterium]|nr:MFS transporter [Bacilli bacterium]
MENKKLTAREWIALILIGFVGQLAWAIENNEINLWVYSQTLNSNFITAMTVASAVAATVTTFLVGAWSDKVGKRKIFISVGYIIWGISVFAFGIVNYNNAFAMVKNQFGAVMMVGITMTVVDCVMTFFGSSANDACFNAYVTDITNEGNRGKVESVLAVLPLFANIAMLGGLAALGLPINYDGTSDVATFATKSEKPWFFFFLIFGIIVTIVGVISIFLLPKEHLEKKANEKYWSNLFYGFRPSVIKENKSFYLGLLTFMAFNCAIDAFIPYYMVYFTNAPKVQGLGLESMDFYIAMGIILIIASALVIVIGLFMDKIGKLKLLIPALALSLIGFIGMYFSKMKPLVIVFGVIMMSGYLIGTAVIGAQIRDETPKDKVGLFQGVRMIFAVMLPMIIGSYTSQAIFNIFGTSVTDINTGVTTNAPTKEMFLVSAGFLLLAIIPTIFFLRLKWKEKKIQK